MSKILIVDDERSVRMAFASILAGEGHDVATADEAETALALLGREDCDLVVMDICLPGMNGLDALARIQEMRPRMPVIVMTGHGTTETAIEATKRGAYDYHLKPFDPAAMLQTIGKALEGARLMKGQIALGPPAAAASDAIIGRCQTMQQVYKAIGRVAQTDATVLIRGESGTGKELVARAIYQHSKRSHMPLFVVNCAAIPETLLESELFGYEPGAFTGAVARRIGKFEQAHSGTILLDEIGDIPAGIQVKILRLLQDRTFQRLGGNQTIRVDVRVICATNRRLEKAMAEGSFREDLFHRLNVVVVQIPPLRERREDVPLLVDYFLDRFSRELEIEKPPVAEAALETLVNYPWPGNVRELEHVIHRVLIFTRGYTIQASDLPRALVRPGAAAATTGDAESDRQWLELIRAHLSSHAGPHAHDQLLETVERLLLTEALGRTRGNQTHAARLLGLARPTLHAKMQKFGLHDLPDDRES